MMCSRLTAGMIFAVGLRALRITGEFIFLDVLPNRHILPMLHLVDLRIFAAARPCGTLLVHFARLLLSLPLPLAVSGFRRRPSARGATRLAALASSLCRQFAILRKASSLWGYAFTALAASLRSQLGILREASLLRRNALSALACDRALLRTVHRSKAAIRGAFFRHGRVPFRR